MSGQHVYRRGCALPVITLLLRCEREQKRRQLEQQGRTGSRRRGGGRVRVVVHDPRELPVFTGQLEVSR